MEENKNVIIVDDLAETPEAADFRYVDPMGPKASPLVREPEEKPFGDKFMLVNATDEHGMLLCPACGKGSTWKEGEEMKTRGPMQYLTVPGRGKALVHRCCIQLALHLLFPAPAAPKAESQVKSSITITPVSAIQEAKDPFPTSTCGHYDGGGCKMDKTECDGHCGDHASRAIEKK